MRRGCWVAMLLSACAPSLVDMNTPVLENCVSDSRALEAGETLPFGATEADIVDALTLDRAVTWAGALDDGETVSVPGRVRWEAVGPIQRLDRRSGYGCVAETWVELPMLVTLQGDEGLLDVTVEGSARLWGLELEERSVDATLVVSELGSPYAELVADAAEERASYGCAPDPGALGYATAGEKGVLGLSVWRRCLEDGTPTWSKSWQLTHRLD